MATLRGLRFLILVLTGLAVCIGSTAAQGSSTPSTQSNTTVSQDPNTSYSPSTVSNVTTASLSPPTSITPGDQTTPDTPSCTYIIEGGINESYAFAVRLKTSELSPENYSIEYKDTFDNSTGKQESCYNATFQIPFKALKPCRNYTVHVQPPCRPNGTNTFPTKKLEKNDVKPKLNTTNWSKVCFETKWNLTQCTEIKPNKSCLQTNFTFNEDKCQTEVEIIFPPSEKPKVSHENKIPTTFTVKSSPKQCNNTIVKCEGIQPSFVNLSVAVDKIKPFSKYTCRGIFDYYGDTIQSEGFPVNIKCDLTTKPEVKPSNTSITSSWILTSPNCPQTQFETNGTCLSGEVTVCKMTDSTATCSTTKLEPFTNYSCTQKVMYNNHVVVEHNTWTKTLPGIPTLNTLTVDRPYHNVFKINCEISKWHGDTGLVFANLSLGEVLEQHKNHSKCSFTFNNLYYSSKYTVQVYAINNYGKKSKVLIKHHETGYNDRAILGLLGFLIVLTSLALLFVLYKIYLLRRKKSRDEQEMDDLLPANALLPVDPIAADALVEAYKKKIADEGRLFMEEFQSIPRIFSNYTVKEAKKAENQSKNRYVDILPYDYNRVPLSNGGRHDYINASFIEGYKEPNKYIAAQGPKEETVADFWRMIWEQNTSIIVMVTRCEEGNKNKCAQYWPSLERETEIFEDFVVKIKGEENCPDYIIRPLTLMNRKEKTPEREVTHIQFTSWPDHGVPGDPGLLLKLRRRVNSFKNVFSGPVVIHCSAGVGRTGTYICIDAMIESLESEGRVDIYGYVAKLRRQRCLMVQVEAQYVLIHTGLIEYNQFGETEISLTDFHSVVNTLRQKEGNDPSLLEMEYQKLPKFKNWRTSNTASTEENKKKNRYSTVIPYDFNRVQIKLEEEASHESDAEEDEDYSSDEEDETPTKYINASYLDGYWCPKGLISAQGPLSDTVADFLQMLYQLRVKTVVMLSDCTENGQEFCSQYWSDEKKEFGEMVVEVKETETFPTYIRRSLEIQHTKRKESHMTDQYHFLKWAGNDLPVNPLDLIDMMKSIRQKGGYKNSRESRGMPVVVHCNDGSSRSGIFCALWNILDSIDTEKLMDVFQVAKNLRKERQGMITSFEQYKFLYAALEVGFPVQNGEVKKNTASPDTVQVINEETALISTPGENQQVAESSKQEEEQTAAEASEPSEPSEQTEKAPSESTTNGPTVTVEV